MARRVLTLTWEEIQQAHADGAPLVLPVGGVEPHGSHMPLGVDCVLAEELAAHLAVAVDGLLLPTWVYGAETDPGRLGGHFPGNYSITSAHLVGGLCDVLRSARRMGFARVVVVHGSIVNIALLETRLLELSQTDPDMPGVLSVAWWEYLSEQTRDAVASAQGVPRHRDHHAALVETSVFWHLRRDEVRRDRLHDAPAQAGPVPSRRFPPTRDRPSPGGAVWESSRANAALGRELWDEVKKRGADDVLSWANR